MSSDDHDDVRQAVGDLDATAFTYGHDARTLTEIYDSLDYATRWAARPAYDRWSLQLPSEVEANPPEDAGYHGVWEVHAWRSQHPVSFAPARFMGTYAPNDPDAITAIGHRMWTAIGRLWGCLTVDGHPDAPVVVTLRRGRNVIARFATPEDVHRYARMVKVAATDVLDEGWDDHISPHLDQLTARDLDIRERCDQLLAMPDATFYDWAWVVHPDVVRLWEQTTEEIPYLAGIRVDEASGHGYAADDPTVPAPAADLAAALTIQHRTDLTRDVSTPMGNLHQFDPGQPDAWKTIRLDTGELEDMTETIRADLGDFDAVALINGPLRQHLDATPLVADTFRAAWSWLYLVRKTQTSPWAPWPGVRKGVLPEFSYPGGTMRTTHWWEPATLDDARAMLLLLREVVSHLHASEVRAEYAALTPYAMDPGLQKALHPMTRMLALDLSDRDVATWVTGRGRPRYGVGPVGPRDWTGTVIHPERIEPTPDTSGANL